MITDSKTLVTASHDLTLGYHRMGDEQVAQKTLLKIKLDDKVNDAAAKSMEEIFLADLSPSISKLTLRY